MLASVRSTTDWLRARVLSTALSRRIAHGAFWSVVGSMISQGMTLVSFVLVAKILGSSSFGEIGILQSTLAMMVVIGGAIAATLISFPLETALNGATGVQAVRAERPELGTLAITHYQRLLDHLRPDHVHILIDGRIVDSGGMELAEQLDRDGYDHWR